MATPEFKTRWTRPRRSLSSGRELVIPTGTPAALAATFPAWLPPIANRIDFSYRLVKYPELNQYPATPPPSTSTGQPTLTPEFKTRYQRGKRLITLDFAPVYPQIVIETGQDFPSWLPPPAFAVSFEIARTRLPEPSSSETASPNLYPAWVEPPAHRFEFDRRNLIVEISPVFPAAPAPTAQGFPAWSPIETLRHGSQFKQIAPDVFILPPIPPTDESFPAWLDSPAFRREFDIRALLVELNEYPQPVQQPLTAQGFPAWLEPATFRRDFSIRSLTLELDQWTETPPLLIFPKGSIIEQSFLVRTIEQSELIRKIEAD